MSIALKISGIEKVFLLKIYVRLKSETGKSACLYGCSRLDGTHNDIFTVDFAEWCFNLKKFSTYRAELRMADVAYCAINRVFYIYHVF